MTPFANRLARNSSLIHELYGWREERDPAAIDQRIANIRAIAQVRHLDETIWRRVDAMRRRALALRKEAAPPCR